MHDTYGAELNNASTKITSEQWRTLAAAHVGYMLDAADVFLYAFALNRIRADFGLTNAQAALGASFTLLAAAAGGIGGGILADRLGRTRMLVYTIFIYSVGSVGTALSTGLVSLVFWRSIVGIGLGGEWAAGAVLVSEVLAGQASRQSYRLDAVRLGDRLSTRGGSLGADTATLWMEVVIRGRVSSGDYCGADPAPGAGA